MNLDEKVAVLTAMQKRAKEMLDEREVMASRDYRQAVRRYDRARQRKSRVRKEGQKGGGDFV